MTSTDAPAERPADAAAPAPALLARHGDLWALSKPAGMLVHPAAGDGTVDLLAWARAALGAPPTLTLVHRLDKDTSGVVLCASDGAAAGPVAAHFARGDVDKTYLALVHGRLPASGRIDRPLADARRGRPLPASTRFEREEELGAFTLLRLFPETGRKHQLRAHLHLIGHSVVGDRRYGPRRPSPVPAAPGRLWLHAAALALPDGHRFEAPLPPELTAHIVTLRALFA